jgi:semaphorin 6
VFFLFSPIAICPYSPTQNNTYLHTDADELYSATSVGFAEAQQLIYRQKLSNVLPGGSYSTSSSQQILRTDFRNDILNQASFVNTLEYNGYILFFFREQAIETQSCGKSQYSRVARVCKNDKGGSHPYNDRFSSYLKTRLNCSMPGDVPFYFDELLATSNVIEGIYGNERDSLIYTVMTTNDNAIDGSAICVYSMQTLLEAFEGKFKGQRDMHSVWRALDDNETPKPRPGQCVEDSRTLPSLTMNFVLRHPLMNNAINPIHEQPLLIHTGANYKFSSIAVDPQVETLNGNSYDVMFVGTDSGHVLKVINVGDSIDDNKPIVISEQQVLPHGTRVKELRISRTTQRLIVISDNYIRSIPLYNSTGLDQCSQCLESRDPYLVWDNINRECIMYNKSNLPKNTANYFQSVNGKNDELCGSKKNNVQTNYQTITETAKNPLPIENEAIDKQQHKELEERHKYYGVVQGTIFSTLIGYFLREIIELFVKLLLLV